jgi:hypothetical protein
LAEREAELQREKNEKIEQLNNVNEKVTQTCTETSVEEVENLLRLAVVEYKNKQ